ncbi:hypothetical protein HDU78_005654 [Chytriomyces hyalinus]|nr:hypothetical protein HDU78_005654 [Chytriomyces hyalinus]
MKTFLPLFLFSHAFAALSTLRSPAIEPATSATIKSGKLAVVLYAQPGDNQLTQIFKKVAKKSELSGFDFFLTTDSVEGYIAPVVTVKHPDAEISESIFMDEGGSTTFTQDSLARFLEGCALPLLAELDAEDTLDRYNSAKLPTVVALFNSDASSAKIRPVLKAQAKLYRTFLSFLLVDAEKFPSIASKWNPKNLPFPILLMHESSSSESNNRIGLTGDQNWVANDGAAVYEFLESFFADKLDTSNLDDFEDELSNNTIEGDVIALGSGDSLERLISSEGSDVLLLLTTSEKQYKTLFKESFSQAASAVAKRTNRIIFARFTTDLHDASSDLGLDLNNTPSIMLIKDGENGDDSKHGVPYELTDNVLSEKELLEFLQDNAKYGKEVGEPGDVGSKPVVDEHDEL